MDYGATFYFIAWHLVDEPALPMMEIFVRVNRVMVCVGLVMKGEDAFAGV